MAFIGHRCACGHNDLNHTENDKGKRICTANAGSSCGRKCKSQGESELLPTFGVNGRPVERIIPPGDALRAMGDAAIVPTCRCDGCQALYEQLAPAA